jgi:branched-chain amino acid transport system permease protein
MTVVVSALVGLATLRLSGMYFVIFTFGLASLVSAAATWWEFNVAHSSGWYVYLSITDRQIYYQLLALCLAIVALWLWRDRSRMGFAMRTLGADETVARQIGINTVAMKIGTFVVSAVAMALAGAILAPRNSYVTAQTVFSPDVSFLTVIAALLGGATSVWGPMLGVVPLLLVKDYLSAYSSHFSVLLGLILLSVVFFIPSGILGLVQKGQAAVKGVRTGSVLKGGSAAPLSVRAADMLEKLAHRLRAVGRNAPAPPHPFGNGVHRPEARETSPEPGADAPERKALQ